MKITEALRGEHGVFYAWFNHLEGWMPQAGDVELIQAQAASLAAALGSHARLEEELLFTALDPYLGGAGPLAVMRMEHQVIEGSLEELVRSKELEQAKSLLLQAIRTAHQHFPKEEQVLFPMAEQILEADLVFRLGNQWAEARGVS